MHPYQLLEISDRYLGDTTTLIPVLYVPGHMGNFTDIQVFWCETKKLWQRSYRERGHHFKFGFKVYSINFKKAPSAYSASMIIRQGQFVSNCIKHINSVHSERIQIITHQIGGVAFLSQLKTLPQHLKDQINQVVLLGTPVNKHPLCLHRSQHKLYADIREELKDIDKQKFTITSIASGSMDLQINPEITTFHNVPPSKRLHYLYTGNIYSVYVQLEYFYLPLYAPLVNMVAKWLVLASEQEQTNPTEFFMLGYPYYEQNILHQNLAISILKQQDYDRCGSYHMVRDRSNDHQSSFSYTYVFSQYEVSSNSQATHGMNIFAKNHLIGCSRFIFPFFTQQSIPNKKPNSYMVIRSSVPPSMTKFLVADTNYSNLEEVKPYSNHFQEAVYIYHIEQSLYNLKHLIIMVDLQRLNVMLLRESQQDEHPDDDYYTQFKRHNPHYLRVMFEMDAAQIKVPFQPGNKIDVELESGFSIVQLDGNEYNSIVPIKLCMFKDQSLNNSQFSLDYNLYILRLKSTREPLIENNLLQLRLDNQLAFNHSDCVSIDMVDCQSKEVIIIHGDGYPQFHQEPILLQTAPPHTPRYEKSNRIDYTLVMRSKELHYLTIYYDVVNFVGLIARNNRQIIYTLQIIYCMMLWLFQMKRFQKKESKQMPNQTMAVLKFFYSLFFSVSILLYIVTWCRTLLWYDAITQQTAYLNNENIFSVEAYFSTYQGFSVFFAIVSIGSLTCFTFAFLLNIFLLNQIGRLVYLLTKLCFGRQVIFMRPRMWKLLMLVSMAIGFLCTQIKWIFLLINFQLILLYIRMSDVPERTKKLQESVMFLNFHYLLLNIQQIFIYITSANSLNHHTIDMREGDYEYFAHLCWFFVTFNIKRIVKNFSPLIQTFMAAVVTLLIIVCQQQVVYLAGNTLMVLPFFFVFHSLLALKGEE